ncbi:MAG: hypothetical protein EOP82_19800 [Variovorax sp.]|nr:MAG: hypothetical protein EOP82_19800 [Variovorax sp.]
MSTLANLDLVFAAACEHCAALLYGRVRFCPYCGREEPITFGATARATLEPERSTHDRVDTVALVEWKEDLPALIAVPPPAEPLPIVSPHSVALSSDAVRRRLAIGRVAALVLFVLALALGYVHFSKQGETTREPDRRTQEQSASRDQRRDASVGAAEALGLGNPSPAPVPGPPAAETPAIAKPPSAASAANAKDVECNDTLAALALCQPRAKDGR